VSNQQVSERVLITKDVFDREIMRAYLRSIKFTANAVSFDVSSKIDFYAKCLMYHPHAGQTPYSSIGGLFKYIADELSCYDGSKSPEVYMRVLCQETARRPMDWILTDQKAWASITSRNIQHHVFMCALRLGAYYLIQRILQQDIDLIEIDSELFYDNLLDMALEMEQYDLVREILDKGFNVNANVAGRSTLENAVSKGRAYVELILVRKYGLHTRGYLFERSIIRALDVGNIVLANLILEHSSVPVADMEELLFSGLAPACRSEALDIVQLLYGNLGNGRPDNRRRGWRGEGWWKIRNDLQAYGRDLIIQTA
jgi:hypothetical protein